MTEGVGSMQALILKQNISFTLTVLFEPIALGPQLFILFHHFFCICNKIAFWNILIHLFNKIKNLARCKSLHLLRMGESPFLTKCLHGVKATI